MTTTPLELFNHASALPATTQCEMRTKLSRAYYALYSHAVEFHEALGSEGNLLKSGGGTHSRLKQMLCNPTVQDSALQTSSRVLGTQQSLAYDLRVKADYSLEEKITPTDIAKCMRYVKTGLEIQIPV